MEVKYNKLSQLGSLNNDLVRLIEVKFTVSIAKSLFTIVALIAHAPQSLT